MRNGALRRNANRYTHRALSEPTDPPSTPDQAGNDATSASPAREPRAEDSLSRAAESLEDAALSQVGKLGGGIVNMGERIARIGAKVDELPVVGKLGDGVTELGHGVSDLGTSLTELPQVARTREGRLLLRSFVVGMLVVFAAFAGIIYWQVKAGTTPNLRAQADAVLVELGARRFSGLYANASARLQEVTREETFVQQLSSMRETVGEYRQITAINDTLVTQGPSGTIARVELVAEFSRGKTQGTVSLQRDNQQWRLLGLSLTLIGALAEQETNQVAREKRAKTDPSVRQTVEQLLTQLRDQQHDAVWSNATSIFQQSISVAELASLEADRRVVLGTYVRVLDVISAKVNPSATVAGFDALVEYTANTTRVAFGLARDPTIATGWRLNSYRVILPLPRVSPPHRASKPSP